MKLRKLVLLVLPMALFLSCNNSSEGNNSTETAQAEANAPISDLSIYQLPSEWTNQDGEQLELKDLRGKVLAMVMIYTECKAACPRLVADMRNMESEFSKEELEQLQFVFVSIDPKVDTPDRMKEFLKINQMEADHWLFLSGTEEDTREFAAVLAVSYKRISPIDFSHSNIISIFNEEGELVHQREGLGVNNEDTVEAIKSELEVRS